MHAAPDTSPVTLDQTEAALGGPLTALTPSAALGIIDHWRAACLDAGLDSIAEGLTALRDLLSGDRVDGRAVAATLAQLAESTRAAAPSVSDAPARPRLERIAAHLDRAAASLGT